MCKRRRRAACFLILALSWTGCGKEAEPEPEKTITNRKKLEVIGQTLPAVGRIHPNTDFYGFWQYCKLMESDTARWPGKLDDMISYGLQKDHGLLVKLIKEGDYVVLWTPAPPAHNSIFAYVKDTPTKGGVVLMGNGDIRNMSLMEFNQTPKAATVK